MVGQRKDVYSAMPEGSIGGFGRIDRERRMVTSPMRNGKPKHKRKKKKNEFLEEKSLANKMLIQKSFERSFQKRLDSIDDEVLDVLFPNDNDESIDLFISNLNKKWLFDGIGGYVRRALKNRRRRNRRDKRQAKNVASKTYFQTATKTKQGPCWDGYKQVGMKKGKKGNMVPNCVPIGGKSVNKKSLDKWFKEDWVDISRPKKGGGFEPCGRDDAKTGKYPKCVPASKAAKMSKSEIASAVRRKRKAERTQTRVDKKPINVSTSAKSLWVFNEDYTEVKGAIPTNPKLYAVVKAAAKKKFDVYPSAYANAWLVREYKKRGGKYKAGSKSVRFDDLDTKAAKKKLRDPKGGLTAAGRAHFKRTEGANLKPGVKGAANTPEKMRRKGSFLTRFFTNPSGPMVGDNGKPTRLALSAAAWGEPVPKNRSDAAKLAAKGRRLLERYENTKKKKKSFDINEVDSKNLIGPIWQQTGA